MEAHAKEKNQFLFITVDNCSVSLDKPHVPHGAKQLPWWRKISIGIPWLLIQYSFLYTLFFAACLYVGPDGPCIRWID